MNQVNTIDTLSLLHSKPDFIHLLFLNSFRILKPVRRKYKMTINSLVVLIGCYIYHCYNGSFFNMQNIYETIGYYNRPKLKYYLDYLIVKGCLSIEENKNKQYYKLTFSGLQVIQDFQNSYNNQLAAWLQSRKIEI